MLLQFYKQGNYVTQLYYINYMFYQIPLVNNMFMEVFYYA